MGKKAKPIREKRTLIITDEFFSIPSVNPHHLDKKYPPPFTALFQLLLKEGFILYGHTHAGLKEIENEWELLSILPRIVAATEKTVLEIALLSHGLYQDKVKVLNAATLRYLLIKLKNHLTLNPDEQKTLSKGISLDLFAQLSPLNRLRLYESLQGSPRLELEITELDKKRVLLIDEVK